MEREVAAVQERLSAADKRLSRLSDAQARAKEAQNTILRVQGEFVDEQLAELSPLLEELPTERTCTLPSISVLTVTGKRIAGAFCHDWQAPA